MFPSNKIQKVKLVTFSIDDKVSYFVNVRVPILVVDGLGGLVGHLREECG